MRKKKGRLQEILSKAIYADDPHKYIISYRDFDTILSIPLLKFIEVSQNFEIIPATRIIQVKKGERIMYEKKFAGIKGN
jgi:hypothetical protein